MIADGRLRRTTLVWTRSLTDWTPAGELAELKSADWPSRAEDTLPAVLRKKKAAGPSRSAVEILHAIGRNVSDFAELSTISRVPVRQILAGGLTRATRPGELEETFAVGTLSTTPQLSEIEDGWPTPRVFWRVLLAAVAAYALLRIGITGSRNPTFFSGLAVVESFLLPLAAVILFFELNSPKNVSVYQVARLLFLGGALSLLLTSILVKTLPGFGTGNFLPALLTGVLEETAKALALLVLARNPRYRWQLNGLLFGAALGAGFGAFEAASSGFGFGWLAPGGHVIWTAMVGSAIWRVKGNRPFRFGMLLAPVVIRRWSIAVVLHVLWNTTLGPPGIRRGLLSIVGWCIVLGIVTQALDEVAAEKKKAAA